MKTIKFLKGDIYKGNLILVNGTQPLRSAKEPPCVPILDQFPKVLLHIKASACLHQLLKTIGAGDNIVLVSGYRPLSEQQEIYQDSLTGNGLEFTQKYVAKPGCSEHQSGLAIDLGLKADSIDFICPNFPDTGICGDFRRLAARYGFIQRYSKEKESITNIACEPWHFRYVGYPHSEIMEKTGLCLEEYTDYIKTFPHEGTHLKIACTPKEVEIFYLDQDTEEVTLPEDFIVETSGNNVDGHIVTVWHDGPS